MKNLTNKQIDLLNNNKCEVRSAIDVWSSDPELTESVLIAIEQAKENQWMPIDSEMKKIKQIRKIAGVTTHLSWGKLCSLTDFDSFATCLAFGLRWNENCPNDRLVTMDSKYIDMILFNLKCYPKEVMK